MSELDKLSLDSSLPHLASLPGVLAVGEWEPTQTPAIWSLSLRLQLDTNPSVEYLALETAWLVVIDFTTDAWGNVNIYPSKGPDGVATTFPHQQFNGVDHKTLPCRTGFICTDVPTFKLAAARNAKFSEPVDTIGRIVWHVERCVQWVKAAASGRLAVNGDKFELPDFNTGEGVPHTFGYQETPAFFSQWKSQGRAGIVELSFSSNWMFLARQFFDRKAKEIIHRTYWGIAIHDLPTTYAIWVRLDAVPVTGQWQAPSTFRELVDSCARQGINLVNEIAGTLTTFLSKPTLSQLGCLLLVGMPVPEIIGEPVKQYHWQALEFLPAQKVPPNRSLASIEQLLTNRLKSNSSIRWFAKSENWSSMELLKRGSVCQPLCSANVVLIGVGALGSALAAQLVRMGVEALTLIDPDLLESGNLVRHQLGIDSLNQYKVAALAKSLNLSNPSARVVGIPVRFPSTDAAVADCLAEASIIIDCSAEDSVLNSISEQLVGRDIPVISCSLGLYAQRLFFYAAAAGQFDWLNFDEWFCPFRQQEDVLLEAAKLPQGIGCWHPLFPAQFNRVEGLSAVALEYIDQIYQRSPLLSPIQTCYDWPDLTLGT